MEYFEVERSEVPESLLLQADPSERRIRSYLEGAWCFAAKEKDQIIGACVVKPTGGDRAEIFNIAVCPKNQQRGTGSALLRFVLAELASKRISRVELGTGTFGYQLAFYQRAGFRVETVVKDHFLDHYPEPLFENGIQHKDMLRLYLDISSPP